jgi:hypothetical protein
MNERHEVIIGVTRMRELADRLDVHGIDFDRLAAPEVDRLLEIWLHDEEVRWKRFDAVAIAAARFAGTPPRPSHEPISSSDDPVPPF